MLQSQHAGCRSSIPLISDENLQEMIGLFDLDRRQRTTKEGKNPLRLSKKNEQIFDTPNGASTLKPDGFLIACKTNWSNIVIRYCPDLLLSLDNVLFYALCFHHL